MVLKSLCAGLFEMAQRLRGMEEFLMDLAASPAEAAHLLDRVLEVKLAYWRAALAALGDVVDVVAEGDDYGTQQSLLVSPATFRTLFKPRLAELVREMKRGAPEAFVFFHSCGSVRKILPDFIEIGVEALNPVQTTAAGMEPRELKREFGRDIAFWGGGVDTQSVLPHGTPAEVAEDVRRNLDALAEGGGYVFGTVHNIQADVPAENVVAMVEALRAHGAARSRPPTVRRGPRSPEHGRGPVERSGRRPWPRLRFVVAGLLCLASTSNYLDRQALSVLADTVKRDLGFSAADYADITSAFLLSYMVMYLVGGWIVDRIGTRWSFLLFASAWSLVTMAHGLASSVRGFQAARFLLGATQPVNFPAGVRAAAEWFPMRERALAVGVFNAGTALGSTLAVPIVSAVALLAGWRWAFAIVGESGVPLGGGVGPHLPAPEGPPAAGRGRAPPHRRGPRGPGGPAAAAPRPRADEGDLGMCRRARDDRPHHVLPHLLGASLPAAGARVLPRAARGGGLGPVRGLRARKRRRGGGAPRPHGPGPVPRPRAQGLDARGRGLERAGAPGPRPRR